MTRHLFGEVLLRAAGFHLIGLPVVTRDASAELNQGSCELVTEWVAAFDEFGGDLVCLTHCPQCHCVSWTVRGVIDHFGIMPADALACSSIGQIALKPLIGAPGGQRPGIRSVKVPPPQAKSPTWSPKPFGGACRPPTQYGAPQTAPEGSLV